MAAYDVLASGGLEREARWVRGDAQETPTRILSPETARHVTLFLADPMARLPTFTRMGTTEYAFPVAVKNGTSQGYRDAWTVPYSKECLVGVWVGRPDQRPMDRMSGARSAAVLAQRVLQHLHGVQVMGTSDLSFPHPDGYRPVTLCAQAGRVPAPSCSRRFTEWLAPAQEAEARVGSAQGLTAALGERADGTSEVRTILASKGTDSATKASLQITYPKDGSVLAINPDNPPARNMLMLQGHVEPDVEQVVWYMDGEPHALEAPPYATAWRLERGLHTFQLRLPYQEAASDPIRVPVW